MIRRRWWWRIAIAAAVLAWLGGFAWFAGQVPRQAATPIDPAQTDAIIVLTGGSQRVENGISLLAAGKARKLFISGVNRSTDVKALLHASNQPAGRLTCCIELGHAADNTRGNAAETAAWMRAEHFHSLRLVTASYHMPRSLLEFSHAMPDLRIVANPVFPKGVPRPWWRRPHAAGLVLVEYVKYLFAWVRLQAFGPAA
jgi:uncharacterized SAM-binding protein YcdF (DUF218 family)